MKKIRVFVLVLKPNEKKIKTSNSMSEIESMLGSKDIRVRPGETLEIIEQLGNCHICDAENNKPCPHIKDLDFKAVGIPHPVTALHKVLREKNGF